MLGLVSRFNLPPVPNPDNSYPVPDANNPFADPQFPFANPPYAARAYSYVAVAQFDALKVAWHLQVSLQPSRAVARGQRRQGADADHRSAGLSVRGRGDVGRQRRVAEAALSRRRWRRSRSKAAEQRQAALLSGKATASDIAAGLALGQAVAAVFVAELAPTACGLPAARRRCGRRSPTARPRAVRSRGRAMDVPARPPMLPAFGSVRAWMMTPADIVRERPGPPPSTGPSRWPVKSPRCGSTSIAARARS